MSEWKRVKIGEIAKHRKGSVIIRNDVEYKLCRVQLHRKGVLLREIRRGIEIKTKKQQICHAGDLVVAEMDAKFGGYGFINEDLEGAIVSSHYYLFELDSSKVCRDYFQVLIHSGFIQNQIEAKGSTNYSSIRAWEFLDYTVPLPRLEHQRAIARRFSDCYSGRTNLDVQSNEQLSLLQKLRQAVLQEAIEGKLTAKWRKQNPELTSGENHASKLLEKIKAEKDRLNKEGKIKKDKLLMPIADEEKPFELPEGWVWCRLGSWGFTQTGTTPSTFDTTNFGKFLPFVKPADISLKGIDYSNEGLSEKGLAEGRLVSRNSILMVCIGGSIGKSYFTDRDISCNQQINCITPLAEADSKLLQLFLQSKYFQVEVWDKAMKSSTPIINKGKWEEIPLPIPPLLEQRAILSRLDKIMTMIDELERQIIARKSQSQMLMQSVLREAFAVNK